MPNRIAALAEEGKLVLMLSERWHLEHRTISTLPPAEVRSVELEDVLPLLSLPASLERDLQQRLMDFISRAITVYSSDGIGDVKFMALLDYTFIRWRGRQMGLHLNRGMTSPTPLARICSEHGQRSFLFRPAVAHTRLAIVQAGLLYRWDIAMEIWSVLGARRQAVLMNLMWHKATNLDYRILTAHLVDQDDLAKVHYRTTTIFMISYLRWRNSLHV